MTAPVIFDAAGEAKCTSKAATCAGCTHLAGSAAGMAVRFLGVSMVPGRITFAEIPLFSSATVRIKDTKAAFDAEYAPIDATGSAAIRLPIARMTPEPCERICGITAPSMWNVERKLTE